ncbi:MAG: (2Fe-2S) ferredoxin domain-containing protein, partial [Chloroflexi bacterium]|nr:(2Fe-2S) ferredoxin domain-containing protein [Chloroflexota bacterium]
VCVDRRRCMYLRSNGRNGPELLEELKTAIEQHGLKERVQVTQCQCILGCTYGPRIDLSKRWSREKVLYGIIDGEVTISIRGRVKMSIIPAALLDLALDNLPEK